MPQDTPNLLNNYYDRMVNGLYVSAPRLQRGAVEDVAGGEKWVRV